MDEATGLYDYGARYYDPAIARWGQIDPLAEKYAPISPYAYVANNPLLFVDPDGMRIDISIWQKVDEQLGTNYVKQIESDLSEVTGLTVTTSNEGFLEYEDTGSQKGSATAKGFLMDMIDHDDTASVGFNPKKSLTAPGTNRLVLGKDQIDGFIEGTSDALNDKTMGWGMILLHELHHTNMGGGLIDVENSRDFESTGPTVNRMNQIRTELDENPFNNQKGAYGQRTHYNSPINFDGSSRHIFTYKTVRKNGSTKVNHTAIEH